MPKTTTNGVWDHPPVYPTSEELANRFYCLLPLSEGYRYSLICVETVSTLIQDFSCPHANQAATISRLDKLSTMCRGTLLKWTVIRGHILSIMRSKSWQKNMTLNGGANFFITHKDWR